MDTVSGVMAVGWKQIDKSWYYFNQAGHMITGWLNDGGRYYYLNPADGKMIANGSFVVNNVNYTFNQSGVCLSETSAIDGGSAGSVYTPGTGGTVANGNYTGTPAAGNAQNGITTGNRGSGNAAAGSAPGGRIYGHRMDHPVQQVLLSGSVKRSDVQERKDAGRALRERERRVCAGNIM